MIKIPETKMGADTQRLNSTKNAKVRTEEAESYCPDYI